MHARVRFIAFYPYASRVSYETWILPKQHAAFFANGSGQDLAGLARCLCDLWMRVDRALDKPPFNFIIHSTPAQDAESSHYHWHIELLPKLNQIAGFEWGAGSFINAVAPEHAARLLRGTLP